MDKEIVQLITDALVTLGGDGKDVFMWYFCYKVVTSTMAFVCVLAVVVLGYRAIMQGINNSTVIETIAKAYDKSSWLNSCDAADIADIITRYKKGNSP